MQMSLMQKISKIAKDKADETMRGKGMKGNIFFNSYSMWSQYANEF